MQKIIFGIFAHPDDEAFGPSGTLIKEVREGAELHLISLTTGQAGTNPDNHADLGAIRREEWQVAGTLIGAASMHELGFGDGQLGNIAMLEAAQKIEAIVTEVVTQHDSAIEIEFMTLDLNGITGHIDHIVAARAACLVFYRLKAHDNRYQRIRFACLPASQLIAANTTWLYMEAGHPDDEISEVVDARDYRDEIIAVMRAHHSQRADAEASLARNGDSLGMNYFLVRT